MILTALLAGALLASAPVQAQGLPPLVPSVRQITRHEATVDTTAYRGDTGGAVLGALVLGAVGFATVWYTGDLEAALWLEAVGIGAGAHIGNGGRGNPLATFAASVGVLLLGRFAGERLDLGPDMVLLIPLAQVFAAVVAETATTRNRR